MKRTRAVFCQFARPHWAGSIITTDAICHGQKKLPFDQRAKVPFAEFRAEADIDNGAGEISRDWRAGGLREWSPGNKDGLAQKRE